MFDASLSSIQLSNVYTKSQVDASFVSKQLFEASYNVLAASNGGGSGGYIQNNENISFDILNITDKIIFTDSSNVELYNDASFNNVDISGSLKVAGSISASNIYTKSQVDVSFVSKQLFDASLSSIQLTNVYTKTEVDVSFVSKQYFEASYNVYSKTEIDSSFANIYTKSQVDISFANVYTKSQIDVSFVSKQLFDASINALAVSGGGSSSTQYDNNIKILPDWTPIVEISNNLYTNLGYGDQVVFSKDGSTVATNAYEYIVPETTAKVGRAFIYHYNGTSWVQKGQPIDGKFNNFGFPIAMSLSSNGNVIALGYHRVFRHHDSLGVGVVIIYNYNMTTLLWEQLGNDIFSGRRDGDIRHPPYMYFFGFANMGESLALSGDGTIIAIGAPNSSSLSDYYNGVVVYKYETRNSVLDWYETSVILFVNFQIDIDIFGSYDVGHPNNSVYENFGKTIALSSDGTVIAVASPNEPKNDFPLIRSEPYHAGVVRTFKWNGIYWINTGRIVGEYEWDGDGEPNNSISLSANGNILAIGSLKNSARSSYNGSVRVYLWNNTDNSWNKLGDTFYGQGEVYGDGDESRIGNYVSLSDDGTIIAISSGSGSDSTGVSEYKHGRVYKWDGTSWNRIGNAFHQGNTVALSGDGNYVAVANGGNAIETISIYDLQQNNIISINLTNLFFLDGSTYSYRKNDIKNSIFQINENSVHSEYYSDFPNKFTRTLYILQNGSLYNRTNTYGSFSDIRLKENIIDATPKLQDLLKVRVVNYNLKGSTNKQIGVLAQELEEIFPGLVETENSGEKYKSVKYSCINIMLVKALQEQQVLINDMSSNINTLKDEIATLKQNMASLLTRIQALEPNASQ